MRSFPGHALGKLDHGIDCVEYDTIPVILQNAPAAFDWIVFAVIGWIVGQTHRQTAALSKSEHPLHELAASAMVLRAIVKIDHECGDVSKAHMHRFPPAFDTIG